MIVRVGPYELLAEIGRGGMGSVHRARAADGRIVAIKILARGANVERFRREERLQESLGEEAGFVPLLDSGESPAGPYLVMPLVEGGTLGAKLARGPLSVAETLDLGRTLAAALGRAHALGVIHRDVKPANILFTREGRPLLADLGLAKHFRHDVPGASRSVALSQGGQLRGTIGYAPSEQLDDAMSAGPAADVFALGAILQECLTGEPAFSGENFLEVISKVQSGERAPLLRPDAPRALVAAIEKALAHDPALRFEDGAAFAAALLRVSTEGPPSGFARPLRVGVFVAVVAAVVSMTLVRTRTTGPLDSPVAAGAPLPDPSGGFAPICSSFARSKRLRLVQVLGDWDGKAADPIRAAAFTPDGEQLVTALGGDPQAGEESFDPTLALWDLGTGADLRRFEGHTKSVLTCAFTPGGTLVSGSQDGKIFFWDRRTGERTVTIDAKSAVKVVLAPPASRLVIAGTDEGIQIYDADTGELKQSEHLRPMLALASSDDGDRIFSGDVDGNLRVWTRSTGTKIELGREPGTIRAVALGHDGLSAYSAGEGLVRWRLTDTGIVREPLTAHRGTVRALLATKTHVVSAGEEAKIAIHSVATGEHLRTIEQRGGPIYALAVSPDEKRLFSGGFEHVLHVWDMETGEALPPAVSPDQVRAVLAPGGRLLTGGYEGKLRLWDLEGAKALWTVQAHDRWIPAVAISPDGTRAVTASQGGTAKLWSLPGGELEKALVQGGHGRLLVADFSRDGRTVFVGGSDGAVVACDVATGEQRVLVTSGGGVTVLIPYPDGEHLAVGTFDGALRVIELVKGRVLPAVTPDPGARITDAALSPDGGLLAVGSFDGVVRVRDARTLELKRELRRGGPNCPRLAFVDARRLAASGNDGAIVVWDAPSGGLLDRVELSSARDWGVHLIGAGDGRSFFACTMRGVVLRFAVD